MERFCACGCGKITKRRLVGYRKKGNKVYVYPREYNQFIHGHNGKLWKGKKRESSIGEKISKAKKGISVPHTGKHQLQNKEFLCKCGCGGTIKYNTSKRFNYKLKKPQEYVHGHNPIPKRVITQEQAKLYGERMKLFWKTEKGKKIRQEITLKVRGQTRSPEIKLKISLANRGKKLSEKHKESIRRHRLTQVFPQKDTKLEVLLQQELKTRDIPFSTHIKLLGQPDIFVKPDILIFVDGCYWHSCPICVKPLNQKHKVVNKDERITTELLNQGYDVLRFWEHQIKGDLSGVGDFIQNRINKGVLDGD